MQLEAATVATKLQILKARLQAAQSRKTPASNPPDITPGHDQTPTTATAGANCPLVPDLRGTVPVVAAESGLFPSRNKEAPPPSAPCSSSGWGIVKLIEVFAGEGGL